MADEGGLPDSRRASNVPFRPYGEDWPDRGSGVGANLSGRLPVIVLSVLAVVEASSHIRRNAMSLASPSERSEVPLFPVPLSVPPCCGSRITSKADGTRRTSHWQNNRNGETSRRHCFNS